MTEQKVESFYNTSKQSLQSYEYGFIVRCVTLNVVKKNRFFTGALSCDRVI